MIDVTRDDVRPRLYQSHYIFLEEGIMLDETCWIEYIICRHNCS